MDVEFPALDQLVLPGESFASLTPRGIIMRHISIKPSSSSSSQQQWREGVQHSLGEDVAYLLLLRKEAKGMKVATGKLLRMGEAGQGPHQLWVVLRCCPFTRERKQEKTAAMTMLLVGHDMAMRWRGIFAWGQG